MSAILLAGAVLLAETLLGLAMVLAVARLARGPRAQDRVLAFDALHLQATLLLLVLCIDADDRRYFEAALVMGLFGFVGTVAMSKFLLRGEVIE